MKSPLHILHLEDDPNDAELVQSTLEAGGITCATTCVQTQEEFVAALERGGLDLILSDFTLPTFDGLSALNIAHARWPEVPLIFVSGTLGEERAVDSLKSGATDYVLKNHLTRLVPAVRRAMQDVAECAARKELEAQLIAAQKMEVIGHLAGGVAHDFNNILSVIMGYSDLLLLELEPDDKRREFVQEIRHASDRAVGLTRQLLIFSRKQVVQPVVLDLNEVVHDMEKMLGRLIDEHIALRFLPGTPLGHIQADAGHIGQVLMNLVVNARDAMPNGGQLTIATRNVTLAENQLRHHPGAVPGEHVMLSVRDTGAGMTDEVKARIFEPFFTTKPAGCGTGLGLATCQTIIQQSRGHIDVVSELGQGASFKIYFPCVDQPLAVDSDTNFVKAGPLPRGTETLLVVEDEASVRHLACGVLKKQGYEVLSAANGQDGLHVVRDHRGSPIRLVVTDVIMPLMDGKVMAEWLKATYPDLKILFTSGYTDDAIAKHGVLEPGIAFLAKPYPPATLARRVRALLDGQTDSAFLSKRELPAKATPPTPT
jgi:signal transduction histidine kinase